MQSHDFSSNGITNSSIKVAWNTNACLRAFIIESYLAKNFLKEEALIIVKMDPKFKI